MEDILKKQLLIHVFELLAKQGLLSEDEKNRLKVMAGGCFNEESRNI